MKHITGKDWRNCWCFGHTPEQLKGEDAVVWDAKLWEAQPPPTWDYSVPSVSWEDLYKRLADIRRTKANDYTGGQPDDMANYRNAADFAEMPMEKLLLARMQEKMYRLKMLLNRTERQVMDETFTDTCVDIANLALLLGKEHNG